jgi:NTE family protein
MRSSLALVAEGALAWDAKSENARLQSDKTAAGMSAALQAEPLRHPAVKFAEHRMREDGNKTAFIFAGGGSLGSIQVGMLRALAENRVTADMVVGSSVGALNAAYYAGTPTAEGVERLAQIWLGLRRQDVFPISWRTMLGLLRHRDFLVPADGVRRLVDTHLPYRNLEDAKLPVHIVATDLLSGGPVVLSKGPAAQAIIASTAIPAVFPPVHLDSRYLADGAITSNTPVGVAVDRGARRLIVLPTGYACALERPPRSAIACALHALTLLITRQLLHELNSLKSDIEFHVVPPLCPLEHSPYDFSMTAELIERSTASTNTWIANDGLGRREIPLQMRTHDHL